MRRAGSQMIEGTLQDFSELLLFLRMVEGVAFLCGQLGDCASKAGRWGWELTGSSAPQSPTPAWRKRWGAAGSWGERRAGSTPQSAGAAVAVVIAEWLREACLRQSVFLCGSQT